jgi:hypothetical protein
MSETYNYRASKIVAVLYKGLQPGVALNIVAHLSTRLGASKATELMGRAELPDASGVIHHGIAKYPIIITRVKESGVRTAIEAARANPAIFVADFPAQMLDTGHDDDLAAAMAAANEKDLRYHGALLYGPSTAIDAITGRFSLWRSEGADAIAASAEQTEPGPQE